MTSFFNSGFKYKGSNKGYESVDLKEVINESLYNFLTTSLSDGLIDDRKKNFCANFKPSPFENDSTFIIKICKSVPVSNKVFNKDICFLDLSDVFQRTTFFSM